MLGRLIRKAVIATSLLLAIALAVVGVRSRDRGLLVGGARNGTYGEARAANGMFSVTTLTPWLSDSPTRAGRAPVTPVGLLDFGDSALRRRMMLLDGTSVLMDDAPLKWWPPLKRTANAYPQQFFRGNLQISGGTLITTTRFSVPRPPAAGWIVSGGGTLSVNPAMPLAKAPATQSSSTFNTFGPTPFASSGASSITISGGTLALQRGAVTSTTRPAASAMLSTLKEFGDIGLAVKPPPTTAPSQGIIAANTLTFTARVATTTYEQYALPQWVVIGLVLTPVWLAALAAGWRWRRRIVRRRNGQCEACGYDLRGNVSGACPECGAIPYSPPAATDLHQPMGEELVARLR